MSRISDNLVTASEAARDLGVDRSRVSQYVKEGKLVPDPVLQRLGRIMFKRSQIDRFKRPPRGYPKGKPRKKNSEKIPA